VNDYCNKCAKPINGLLPLHKFNGILQTTRDFNTRLMTYWLSNFLTDFVHHLHAFSNLKYYKPFQCIIVFFDPGLCISNLIKTIHENATNMVSNGMTIHFFTTTFMTSVYVFKCLIVIITFLRTITIYPLFPYKYLLFPAHSIFIVSGNSHAIIKENLKCDKCFLYDRIRS
jgi:hypothetical protein